MLGVDAWASADERTDAGPWPMMQRYNVCRGGTSLQGGRVKRENKQVLCLQLPRRDEGPLEMPAGQLAVVCICGHLLAYSRARQSKVLHCIMLDCMNDLKRDEDILGEWFEDLLEHDQHLAPDHQGGSRQQGRTVAKPLFSLGEPVASP